MVILGKAEREKFEANAHGFSDYVQTVYNDATTYYDGKWMMFTAPSKELRKDLLMLLQLKRKANLK